MFIYKELDVKVTECKKTRRTGGMGSGAPHGGKKNNRLVVLGVVIISDQFRTADTAIPAGTGNKNVQIGRVGIQLVKHAVAFTPCHACHRGDAANTGGCAASQQSFEYLRIVHDIGLSVRACRYSRESSRQSRKIPYATSSPRASASTAPLSPFSSLSLPSGWVTATILP